MPDAARASRAARAVLVGTGADPAGPSSAAAGRALRGASAVAGTKDQIDLWRSWVGPGIASGPDGPATKVTVAEDAADLVRIIRAHLLDAEGVLCALVPGDPGFFGIARAVTETVDRSLVTILPAPSPVALGFARLALPWDDALVVATEGRSLDEVVRLVRRAPKVAVLTGPATPEQLGRALVDLDASYDLVGVVAHPGTDQESARELTLGELAGGRFPPDSVVVLVGPGGLPGTGWEPGGAPAGSPALSPPGPPGAWSPPTGTSPAALVAGRTVAWSVANPDLVGHGAPLDLGEVGGAVVATLDLPAAGVLWVLEEDEPGQGGAAPGGGPGALAIACSVLRPQLTVFAIGTTPAHVAAIAPRAWAAGAHVHVLHGQVPAVLGAAPPPDRAVVAGADPAMVHAALGACAPGGRVVAVTTSMSRALAAARILGSLRQITVASGTQDARGEWVLSGQDPVFVCAGPLATEPP